MAKPTWSRQVLNARRQLPRLLKQRGRWSQPDLALALGVTPNTVYRWESGLLTNPSDQSRRMLAYTYWIARRGTDPRKVKPYTGGRV